MTNVEKKPPRKKVDTLILSVDDLQVSYGETSAVAGVSFAVVSGEKVAIVGESGSGKSTLVAALLGILPNTGKISGGKINFRQNVRTGYIPQDPSTNLNPVLRVGSQVIDVLGASHGDAKRKKHVDACIEFRSNDAASQLLKKVGLTGEEYELKAYPHEFSGGMKQRVLVGLGIAHTPDVIIADEPTSALDITIGHKVLSTLENLIDEFSSALLFVTHDIKLAGKYADRIIVMKDGKIVEDGKSELVLGQPSHPYTKELVECTQNLTVDYRKDLTDEKYVSAYTFQVNNLVKTFKKRGAKDVLTAVNDVSFNIVQGQSTAIVGESGSGKTTLVNLLLGVMKPTNGEVIFEGENLCRRLRNRVSRDDFTHKVSVVYQNPYSSLNPRMKVADIIAEPLVIHAKRITEYRSREIRTKRVNELLELVGLETGFATRFPSSLSGGQRQRVAIARALAISPEIIFLDEAVSALDVLTGARIVRLLRDLQQKLGLTIIFVTHDLSVARSISDKVIVMQDGKIVEQGDTATIFNAPSSKYAKESFQLL